MSCRLEPAIWSRDTGQQIPCFDRCQLIISPISKMYTVNQDWMSLSTYYLEYGRHVARLHRRRRRAYASTSNTAVYDNHEKIHTWVSFPIWFWGSAWRPAPLLCFHSRNKTMDVRANSNKQKLWMKTNQLMIVKKVKLTEKHT